MTTIAITGPTGNFGHGLIPLLEQDPAVDRIVGIARRPLDPGTLGSSRLEYRRGDVRDRAALASAFEGADSVAHLAFAKFGHASHETLEAINVQGTMNAFHAAAQAGVRRFVFASSVAAYGFASRHPVPISEDEPARGSKRWFYSREKAQLERLLWEAATAHPRIELTIFRPTIVVGPRTAATIGESVPPALRPLARLLARPLAVAPLRLPVLAPPVPLQLVHEDDVGQALRLALLGATPGIYNLAGDGIVEGRELMRELGLAALPVPDRPVRWLARAVTALPGRPAALEAVQAFTHPMIVDASRAKRELGWRPRYSGIEALRATLSHRDNSAPADRRCATSEPARSGRTVQP